MTGTKKMCKFRRKMHKSPHRGNQRSQLFLHFCQLYPTHSHVDKLSCTFRYVLGSEPVERIPQFKEMKGHAAADLADSIFLFFVKTRH